MHSRGMLQVLLYFLFLFGDWPSCLGFTPPRVVQRRRQSLEAGSSGCWENFYDSKEMTGFGADYRAVVDETSGRTSLKTMGYEEIYGEVSAEGLRRILGLIGPHITEQDEIWDLGSGVGKVVAQFAHETSAGRCNGLELGARRHKTAVSAHAAMMSAGHGAATRMRLVNGDMLAQPCIWRDASIVYINAVWGPDNPLFQGVERIMYGSCPRLRFVIVGGQELAGPFLTPEWERREMPCPITWQDDFQMLLYSKRGLL